MNTPAPVARNEPDYNTATVQTLLDTIKEFETSDAYTSIFIDPAVQARIAADPENEGYSADEQQPIVSHIEGLACALLIGSQGSCNWTNINILRKAGYRVYAGDKDSFGWLVGVIPTKKGRICYG